MTNAFIEINSALKTKKMSPLPPGLKCLKSIPITSSTPNSITKVQIHSFIENFSLYMITEIRFTNTISHFSKAAPLPTEERLSPIKPVKSSKNPNPPIKSRRFLTPFVFNSRGSSPFFHMITVRSSNVIRRMTTPAENTDISDTAR